MATSIGDNETSRQPLPNMNDFIDPVSGMNDALENGYDTSNTSPLRQITSQETDANVQYTFFDNDSFDVNQDPHTYWAAS